MLAVRFFATLNSPASRKQDGGVQIALGSQTGLPCYTDLTQNSDEWTVLCYAGSFSTHGSTHSIPEADITHSLVPSGNWAVNAKM